MKENSVKIGLILAGILALFLAYYFYSGQELRPREEEPKEEVFNLEWKNLASTTPWSKRDSHATFVFQNKLWLIGGINGDGLVSPSRQVKYWEASHFNDVWVSEDGVNWNEIETENIWPPRRSMSIVEFNGRLLMFGGWSPVSGYSNDAWQSSDGINWTKLEFSPAWEAREGQNIEIFQGKLWVMGGVNYDKRKVFADAWSSEDGITWIQATSSIPWAGRWDHATAVFDNKIFLMGGMDLETHVYRDVWSSPDGANWTLVTDSPPWQSRQGHAAVNFGGRLLVMGRLNDDRENPGPNDIWQTKDGVNWESLGELPWDGREDFSATIFKDKIYIMGGMGQDWTWRGDVWEATLKIE